MLTPFFLAVWVVAAEAAERDKQNVIRLQANKAAEEEKMRKEAIRKELGLSTSSDK